MVYMYIRIYRWVGDIGALDGGVGSVYSLYDGGKRSRSVTGIAYYGGQSYFWKK